jgi:hypothetical protein
MKYPSAFSGITTSDRVAIDGASNTVSSHTMPSFFGVTFLESLENDIVSPSKEDQDEQSTEAEQPPNNTRDDISLQWDARAGEDIQRSDTPLSIVLSLVNFDDYCFETPPQVAMMRTPLSPPPTPRPDHAMIQCIQPPIPDKLLLPVV